MKRLVRLQAWVINYWQSILWGLGLFGLPLMVLSFRLGAITDNVILQSEASSLYQAFDKRAIFENPLQITYKLPEYLLRLLHINNLVTIRLVPVAMSLITVLALYYVVRQWYGSKTALAALSLSVCSSWLLAYGRLATPDIIFPMLISLGLAYGAWLRKTKHSGLVMILGVLLGLGYVYSGGLIWLAILAIVWQRKIILRRIADAPRLTATILLIVGVGISPLILATIRHPELINQVAGLSADPSQSFANIGIRSVDIVQQLAVQGHKSPETGLTNVALLDIFTYVMAILGLLTLVNFRKLDRFKVILSLLLALWFLVSLDGPVPIIVLMPIIYLLAAGGIGKMLGDWLKVFPRNPLARTIGISAIAMAVVLSNVYHLQRYFIAWPAAIPTKQAIMEAKNQSSINQSLLQ